MKRTYESMPLLLTDPRKDNQKNCYPYMSRKIVDELDDAFHGPDGPVDARGVNSWVGM